MKNPTDPEELANIFNKKHKEHMDDPLFHLIRSNTLKPTPVYAKEGANKRGNSSRLTQSFHFFMFEPIFSPVNALNQPI